MFLGIVGTSKCRHYSRYVANAHAKHCVAMRWQITQSMFNCHLLQVQIPERTHALPSIGVPRGSVLRIYRHPRDWQLPT
jgi:hypothetical protein